MSTNFANNYQVYEFMRDNWFLGGGGSLKLEIVIM